MRDDYYIENYVNDPRTTPAEQLVTEDFNPRGIVDKQLPASRCEETGSPFFEIPSCVGSNG